jgi:hypothetical protein
MICATKTVLIKPLPDEALYGLQRIPRRIVQTTNTLTPVNMFHWHAFSSFIDLNPEYNISVVNDPNCRKFIKQNFPKNVLDAYDSLIAKSFRADLFRYTYLYINGGCYFDNKMIDREPLREVIVPDDSFLVCSDALPNGVGSKDLSQTTKFYNAVICASQKNENIKRTIDAVVDTITRRDPKDVDLAITGPVAFYRATIDHIDDSNLRFKHWLAHKQHHRHYRDYPVTEKLHGQVFLHKSYNGHTHSQGIRYGDLWRNGRIYYEGGSGSLAWDNYRLFVEQGNLAFYSIEVRSAEGFILVKRKSANEIAVSTSVSQALTEFGRKYVYGGQDGAATKVEFKLLHEISCEEYFFGIERPTGSNPVTMFHLSELGLPADTSILTGR